MRWFKRKQRGMEPPEGARFYGGSGTIHGTRRVNVETHDGQVVSVWFRCQALPFDQTEVEVQRAEEMKRMYREGSADIVGVTMVE